MTAGAKGGADTMRLGLEWRICFKDPRMKSWLFLAIAIIADVAATSGLRSSGGFTKLWPSLFAVAGYALALYFLSLTLKSIPVGIAYGVWAGLGIVLVTLVGWLAYGQKLDAAGVLGMALIVLGVVVINVFSTSGVH